ncbi:uncharacterized protein LOC135827994 [Sycon ciliatum]|uniref:uncharacterized protein LOC135827994 n=1 Tax=Sycon ciliatum TaxID=27933 RepID=UPI0031F66865
MASLKVDNFVRAYRGKGDDWEHFWGKFSVLAKIQGWDTAEKRMKNFPLFLDGDAFLVFTRMPADDQKDEEKVNEKMKVSFSLTKAQAYRAFTTRTLREDESTDAYVADLQRLASLAGHAADDDKDPLLIEQMVSGLPSAFAKELRLSMASKEHSVSGCLASIRALRSAQSDSRLLARASEEVAAAASSSSSGKSQPVASSACFECGKVGHLRRNCPSRSRDRRGRSQPRGLTCFFCDKPGHVKRNCPARERWEAASKGGTAAAAAGERGASTDKCLCTVTKAGQGTLPRVYVDVKPRDQSTSAWKRARAAVDTCATRSLVAEAFLTDHGIEYEPDTEVQMNALNGSAVELLGAVELLVERVEAGCPVHLPRTQVKAFVVRKLDAVNADVLVGADVIAAVGGVHLGYGDDGSLSSVQFGAPETDRPAIVAATVPAAHPSRHVTVSKDGEDVVLRTDDSEVRWDSASERWIVRWMWADDEPPTKQIGSGIGQYSRKRLSPEQEASFCTEVDAWVENGWLVEHDPSVHGEPAAILPLLAKVQEHKASTPVRPCLDYRALNGVIKSNPGTEAPVCADKLRKWRMAGDQECKLIDIRKAYLQVHVDPSLARYQVVVWREKLYVMTRMGFGLSVAPKVMDIIVRWVTREWQDVDSYVDDVLVPGAKEQAVTSALHRYGLPTKPAEPLTAARVLGLQLSKESDVPVNWARRGGVNLGFEQPLTKREVFKWTGRLTSHYPVCSWLRPACAWLKRQACSADGWDDAVPEAVARCCAELADMVRESDPARGAWRVPSLDSDGWTVFCDASDVAIGASLHHDGTTIEDCSWLREPRDHKHINIAELDAVLRALTLAAEYKVEKVTLVTDSKAVAGWVSQVLGNVRRVRVTGLHKLLVVRRLDIIEDLGATAGLKVTVGWVPTNENVADRLTRVPKKWLQIARVPESDESPEVAASMAMKQPATVIGCDDVCDAQRKCPLIQTLVSAIESASEIQHATYRKIREQLVIKDGQLSRTLKLPALGVVTVPIVPECLEHSVLESAHVMSGHASWSVMYDMLRARCFFPSMAARCREYCDQCRQCAAASSHAGPAAPPTQPDLPGRPWSVVQIDTLHLGEEKSGQYHCVLVCVDVFTKWAEAIPLRRHDAISVAEALTSLCCRWGPPDEVRMDNGSEFKNAVVRALFARFGVRVKTGAVRHPQSQGGVERANRTIITLMRKVLTEAADWKTELDLLLYYYRTRPHTTTAIPPMLAMCSWQPRQLIIEAEEPEALLSEWVDRVGETAARVRDHVEVELAATTPEKPITKFEAPYTEGQRVMLKQPGRRRKLTPPYQCGWKVKKIIAPSTVVITRDDGGEKVVNINLLKPDVRHPQSAKQDGAPRPGATEQAHTSADDGRDDGDGEMWLDQPEPADDDDDRPAPAYVLRDRGTLARPARYNG